MAQVLVTSSSDTTRPSCHNRTRPRRSCKIPRSPRTTRCYGLSYHCNTWLMYDPLYEPATGSTHPRLTQHTVITGNIDLPTTTATSFLRWSSSCILSTLIIQLHSTTRPTSAFNFNHPAAFYDSSDLSFQLQSSSCILRLVRPQLSTTTIQLHSATQPTPATCN